MEASIRVSDAEPAIDKTEAKRRELADATLATLGELGYARTSLREIADRSEYSHGLLHYYFADKVDLIVFGIRRYKAGCVTRYDAVVDASETGDELAAGIADAMVRTMHDDAPMHRLWYDLRTEAMFDDGLRPAIQSLDAQLEAMIWRVVTAYAERTGRAVAVEPRRAYALFDGAFEHALGAHLAGREGTADELASASRWLLEQVVTTASA